MVLSFGVGRTKDCNAVINMPKSKWVTLHNIHFLMEMWFVDSSCCYIPWRFT